MVVLFSPQRTDRWSSDTLPIGFLVTLLKRALLPQLLSFDGWSALRRVLLVRTFFNLWMIKARVLIESFKDADIFLFPSPDLCLQTILSQRSADHFFDLIVGLCSDIHCQQWDHILCRSKSCPIKWIYPRWIQLKCQTLSSMISGNMINKGSEFLCTRFLGFSFLIVPPPLHPKNDVIMGCRE